jgi:methanogenic corrinoid protein MtbC1
METEPNKLSVEGLHRFQALQAEAVKAVTERFYLTHGSAYEQFGQAGREACCEDIAFHLEFLRPVLEFGNLQPMVDYLRWLASVLVARSIPLQHLTLSLDWLAEFYRDHMEQVDGSIVVNALQAAAEGLNETECAVESPTHTQPALAEAIPFEAALLAGNQREALEIMNLCLDSGHSLIEVEMGVIQPALYRIGEKWQANLVSVAQEHLASSIVQSVLTIGLLRSPPVVLLNKRVLLACVEGNDHAIGLRMVADAFQLAGWEIQYLGANVPTASLLRQIEEWRPHLVGLSVSFPQQLRVVKTLITQLRERLGSNQPAVIVGGLAINRFKQLGEIVGADASSPNAESAVVIANRMINAGDVQ